MRLRRRLGASVILLVCSCLPGPAALAFQTPGAGGAAKQAAEEAAMIEPADLFKDFPAVGWAMSVQEARAAVEKSGARPFVSRDATQMTWDGKFGGMDGRATVLFKRGSGVYEIAVLVYAFDKRQEVFARVSGKVAERHGEAKEVSETSLDTSKLWRLRNGFVIEVRLVKDDDSPVVDVHWVKG